MISPDYFSIDDLPLSEEQKAMVLTWFARKLWILQVEGINGDDFYYGKSYDPLSIDLKEKVAHSYVFSLENSERQHSFENLQHLEKMLMDEILEQMKFSLGWCAN